MSCIVLSTPVVVKLALALTFKVLFITDNADPTVSADIVPLVKYDTPDNAPILNPANLGVLVVLIFCIVSNSEFVRVKLSVILTCPSAPLTAPMRPVILSTILLLPSGTGSGKFSCAIANVNYTI